MAEEVLDQSEVLQQDPPTKYLYDGKIYQQSDIDEGAKQSGMDAAVYIKRAGLKLVSDSYFFHGKNVSAEDVLSAANQSKMNFEDYISKAGVRPIKSQRPTGYTPDQKGFSVNINTDTPAENITAPEEVNYSNQNPIDLAKLSDELSRKTTLINAPSNVGGVTIGSTSSTAIADPKAAKESEKINTLLKAKGYDPKLINETFKDFPEEAFNIPGFSKEDLAEKLRINPNRAIRDVNAVKWQAPLLQESQSPEVQQMRNTFADANTDYATKRRLAPQLYKAIRQFAPDAESMDKQLKAFSIDAAQVYGDVQGSDPTLQAEKAKFPGLNENQLRYFNYLQDVSPDKAEAFKAALTPDEKIKDNFDAQVGKEEQLKKLEEGGIQLQQNTLNEKYAPLKNKLDELTAIEKERPLSPEEQQMKAGITNQAAPIFAKLQDLAFQQNDLILKYPKTGVNDAELFAQELLGQKNTGLNWWALETGKATDNAVKSVWDLVSEPFRSEANSRIHQLSVLGDVQYKEGATNLVQSNQTTETFKPTISTDLKTQIEAIKDNKELSDKDKLRSATKLLMQNADQWQRTPIEGGKSNIGISSLLYGTGSLASTLAPFMLAEMATGGGASATFARKFTSNFVSMLGTSFHDSYVQALKEGDKDPFAHALRVSSINAAAMAGAGGPQEIRKMLSSVKGSAAGDLVAKMSDKEILGMLRQTPASMSLFKKSIEAARKRAGIVKDATVQGAKSAIHITPWMTGGQVINDAIDDHLQTPQDYLKQAAVEGLKFTILGGVGGSVSRAFKNSPTELGKATLLSAGKNPESFLEAVKQKEANGGIKPEEAAEITNSINTAAEVLKKVPLVNAKGKPLGEQGQRDLLFLKMQEADIEGTLKKDIPEDLVKTLGNRLLDVKDKINDVYSGNLVDKAEIKPEVNKPIEEVPPAPKVPEAEDPFPDTNLEKPEYISDKLTADKNKILNDSEFREGLDKLPGGRDLLFDNNPAEAIANAVVKAVKDNSNPELVSLVKQAIKKPEIKETEKEVGLIKQAADIEDLTDPYSMVLQYFAGKNKIHPDAVKKFIGGKDERLHENAIPNEERNSKFGLTDSKGVGIDELAHQLWDNQPENLRSLESNSEIKFKDAIEDVVRNHNSAASAAKELVDGHIMQLVQKELTKEEAAAMEAGSIAAIQKEVEGLSTESQKELLTLLKKYQDQYGSVDWKKLEEDTQGFNPDIVELSVNTTNDLNDIIERNTRQEKPGNSANENVPPQKNETEIPGTGESQTVKNVKLNKAEENFANQAITKEQAKSIVNRGGLTLENLEAHKHLFEGFPFTKEDYQTVKEYLNEGRPTQKSETTEPTNTGAADNQKASTKSKAVESPQAENATGAAGENAGNVQSEVGKKLHYEEISGSKPNKATGRIAVDPIIGGEPKTLSKILKDFSVTVKQKVLTAKVGRRFGGNYNPGNKAIKLKYSGDLDTTAHEVGHMIDDVHSILPEIRKNPTALKELPFFMNSPAASKPPAGHPDPLKYKQNEGFAEWLRAFIVNPTQAIKEAPEIYKIYNSLVDSKMQNAVKELSDDVRTWAGATGRDQVLSNIEFKPEEAHGLIKKIFTKKETTGNFAISFADKMAAAWTKPLRAFEKAFEFAKGIKGIDGVLPENDPAILARLLLGIDGKFGEIINNGMINSKNEILKTTDGKVKNLNWLLEPLDNTDTKTIETDLKDVVSYMIAERTVELGERFKRDQILSGIGGGIFRDVDVAKKALDEFKTGDPNRLKRMEEAASRYREFSDDVLKYMVDKGRLSKEQYKAIKKDNLQYVAMKRIFESEPGAELVVVSGKGGQIASVSEPTHKIKGSTRKITNPYTSLMESVYTSVKEADRNEVLRAFRDMLVETRGMNDGPVKSFADIGILGKEGDKNAVKIFIDGKPEHWIFQQDIYTAIKGLDTDGYKFPPYVTFLPSLLRNTVTKFPIFALRNIVRDTQDRIIKSNASGLKDLFGDKEHWKDVSRAGGLNAGFYVKDRAHYYGLLETTMDDMAKNKKFILADPVRLKEVWPRYEDLLQKSETVNRVAEYRGRFRKAKKEGMDDYNASLYAAFHARDLIDFAVAGHFMKTVNQIVPFSNASVQGIRSSIVKFKENPAGFIGRTMAYSVLPGAAMWFLNHRNKEDGDEYENLPAYQKDLFWNAKIGENKWLAVPKPFELSLLGAGVDRMLSKVLYDKQDAFDGYAGTVYQSLLPVDAANFGAPITPIVEGVTNHDFFRDKYVIPANEDNLNLALRHTETASRLGNLLQQAVGIDGRKIDHFVRGQFSYTGNLLIKLSDLGKDDSKEEFNLSDLGFFKQSPAYNAPAVQDMLHFAEEWNLKQSHDYKQFSKEARNYFDKETDEEKDKAAKPLIEHANLLLIKWKKEGIDKQKIEKFNKKNKIE